MIELSMCSRSHSGGFIKKGPGGMPGPRELVEKVIDSARVAVSKSTLQINYGALQINCL